ncbi:putative glutathione peroxidase 5 [Platanthera guangdongensis]|uniref:Glutathione peroxidase 5 n=1 Tax=Platanthera guangdongensis TaxID=2320717 RepID=A0ABR2M5L5_9ASPA
MGISHSSRTAGTIHEFTVKNSSGKDVELGIYKGKVLLVVNVASKCGLTDSNYTQLTDLYNKYKNRVLRQPLGGGFTNLGGVGSVWTEAGNTGEGWQGSGQQFGCRIGLERSCAVAVGAQDSQ